MMLIECKLICILRMLYCALVGLIMCAAMDCKCGNQYLDVIVLQGSYGDNLNQLQDNSSDSNSWKGPNVFTVQQNGSFLIPDQRHGLFKCFLTDGSIESSFTIPGDHVVDNMVSDEFGNLWVAYVNSRFINKYDTSGVIIGNYPIDTELMTLTAWDMYAFDSCMCRIPGI